MRGIRWTKKWFASRAEQSGTVDHAIQNGAKNELFVSGILQLIFSGMCVCVCVCVCVLAGGGVLEPQKAKLWRTCLSCLTEYGQFLLNKDVEIVPLWKVIFVKFVTNGGGITVYSMQKNKDETLHHKKKKTKLWIRRNYCNHFFFFFFFFTGHATACRILVPWLGIEPVSTTVEAWSLNHWTAREIPCNHLKNSFWCSHFDWRKISLLLIVSLFHAY